MSTPENLTSRGVRQDFLDRDVGIWKRITLKNQGNDGKQWELQEDPAGTNNLQLVYSGTPQLLLTPGGVFSISALSSSFEIIAGSPVALDPDAGVSYLSTTGAATSSLADPTISGTYKSIKAVSLDGGTNTLTPANFTDGTTITFTADNQAINLQFAAGAWNVLSNFGTTIA